MAVLIERCSADHIPAVKRFNARIAARGAGLEFFIPETPTVEGSAQGPAHQEQFLALQGPEVRGGFILQHQSFWLHGALTAIGNLQSPVSEGLIDTRYSHIAGAMLRGAIKRSPLLFAVGMGGFQRALPRLLSALGWRVRAVPFLFRVLRPGRFLRGMSALRGTPLRKRLMDVAARVGIGQVLMGAAQFRPAGLRRPISTKRVSSWGAWADGLWIACREQYAMIGLRDRAVLDCWYPPRDERYLSYEMSADGQTVGWIVLLNTQMKGSDYFGDLRVGTLLDGLALPRYLPAVVRTAVTIFRSLGVDLVVCNHTHQPWLSALRQVGFLPGPSNYLLATSPQLTAALEPAAETDGRIHITRGDGDGRIHL